MKRRLRAGVAAQGIPQYVAGMMGTHDLAEIGLIEFVGHP